MRHLVFAVMLAAAAATPALAQDRQPTEGHERAAAELLELLQVEEMSRAATNIMVESMISQNPQMASIRDVFDEFFATYLRWDVLRADYIRIYTDAFTEPELRELIAFYRTPVGQKTIRVMPTLMQQGAEVGQRQVQQHLPELQRRIAERMKKSGQ